MGVPVSSKRSLQGRPEMACVVKVAHRGKSWSHNEPREAEEAKGLVSRRVCMATMCRTHP